MAEKKTHKQQTAARKKIIVCASKLFEERGIKDVKMDDIAAKLSMSKRTLYEMFEDKEDLLVECVKMRQEHHKNNIDTILEHSSNVLEVILGVYENSLKELHKTSLNFFQDVNQYPKAIKLLEERKNKDWKESVSFFQKGVDQGLFRPDINFDIFAMILHNQISSLLDMTDWRKFSFFDVYEFIMFTFMRGISTPKGIKFIDNFVVEYRKKEHSM
jgi:AcrR family transcriptional regulator